ncbi:MAG TPA: GAF domain-containing protein, partial [Solirubrobacter sp.]
MEATAAILGDPLRLSVLRRAEIMDTPAERAFDRWCTLAMRLTGGDGACVSFLDEEREFYKCLSGLPSKPKSRSVGLSHSLGQYVVTRDEALWISDARADPLTQFNGAVVELGVVGYAAVPIVAGGMALGTLAVTSEAPRRWGEDARMVIRELADAVSNEISLRMVAGDLRRAREELLAREGLLDSHGRVREMVATGEDLESVLTELVHIIERHDPSVRGSVMLLQPDNTLRTGAAPHVARDYLDAIEGIPVGPDVGTCGAAAFSGRPVFTEDIRRDPRWSRFAELAEIHTLAHCWSIPVPASDGRVLGTFALYGPEPREPDESLLEVVRYAAHVAATAIERERANERILYEATHDAMTGLWNRTRILDRLRDVLSGAAAPLALLLLDLDRLALFNDSLGHDLGDDVIAETARRLVGALPPGTPAGRLGGDEFAVLLDDTPAADAIEGIPVGPDV